MAELQAELLRLGRRVFGQLGSARQRRVSTGGEDGRSGKRAGNAQQPTKMKMRSYGRNGGPEKKRVAGGAGVEAGAKESRTSCGEEGGVRQKGQNSLSNSGPGDCRNLYRNWELVPLATGRLPPPRPARWFRCIANDAE